MVFPMGSMAFPISCTIYDHNHVVSISRICSMTLILLLMVSTLFLEASMAFPFFSVLYATSNAALYSFYVISRGVYVMSYGLYACFCFYGISSCTFYGAPYVLYHKSVVSMLKCLLVWSLWHFLEALRLAYGITVSLFLLFPLAFSSSFSFRIALRDLGQAQATRSNISIAK